MRVNQASGIVVISGISSQPVALQLCERLKEHDVKTALGMIPGVSGYQVSIFQLGIDEAKAILHKIGIDAQYDGGQSAIG